MIGWFWILATLIVAILYEYEHIGPFALFYMVTLITAVDWFWDSLMKILRETYEEPGQ